MKVAKLLLAAAIAAPSLFLTSCEKQIDVQAETMNREATRSLGKAEPAVFFINDAVDESGWTLSAILMVNYPLTPCGTGTFQKLVGTKWVDVTEPLDLSSGTITYNLSLLQKPEQGTSFRVFYVPSKGKNGCETRLQRGASAPYSTLY